jgi:hypothetical protein
MHRFNLPMNFDRQALEDFWFMCMENAKAGNAVPISL